MAKGSDTEDVADMMKNVIIVMILKSNLYIFPSSKSHLEISINSLEFTKVSLKLAVFH